MDKYGLRPISRQKGVSQSVGNQSQVITPQHQNTFRIKNVNNLYDSSLLISGSQIKSESAIFDHQNHNYALRMIDLNQTEENILTLLRQEISMLQQEINENDKDGKIRTNSQKAEFNKGHVNTFKRWLLTNSRSVLKYEENMSQEFQKVLNIESLCEQLKAQSKDQCIHKLFRVVQGLDLFLFKLTEYLTITYMRFEDFVSKNIPHDPHVQLRVNNLIKGSVIFPNNISAVHSDRFNLLFKHYSIKINEQYQNKLQSSRLQGTPFHPVNDAPKTNIQTINEFIKYIETLKPNTLLNSEFIKTIKSSLSSIEQSEFKNKDQLNLKQTENISKLHVQIDQLQKQIVFLESQNNQIKQNTEQQLQNQEAEHIKQIEMMQLDLQQQIQSQIEEKVNSLNKQIQDQETVIQHIQAQYQDMLNKSKEKQNTLNTQQNSLKEGNKENKQPSTTPMSTPEDQQKAIQMIEELKSDYQKTIEILRAEVIEFKQKFQDMKINCEATHQELLNLKQLYNQLLKDKEEMTLKLSQKFMSKQEFTDTFEQALKEEFKRMKKSFEDRIERLNQEITTLKRDKMKSLVDMKQQLDREIETKNLLMKKLSIYLKF